ncbi:MAG: cytochrome c peroxidase [Acidobacteriota bacterium]
MVKTLSTADRFVAASAVLAAAVIGWALMASTLAAQGQTLQQIACPTGFGPVVPPPGVLAFAPLTSLKTVANPVIPKSLTTGAPTLRDDLLVYVADLPAAVQLGKALFWDMQVGSDGRTACATCHFHAGADARTRNQIHPSADKSWNTQAPNFLFNANGSDFPFVLANDNAAGSQGIRKSTFKGIDSKGREQVALVADPVFSLAGTNLRQATAVNSPTAINSVFNHRNFHNGRAQSEFNGVNPFGARDTTARVWTLDAKGNPVLIDVHIANASLASQAVGPPLNTSEMSAAGRTFPDLARKLLLAKPLGLQQVAADDSVLGPMAASPTGLSVSYATLIQRAFQPKWWNSNKTVKVNGKLVSMTEANFSLFWGLSLMLYQATLVSDDSPMDQYIASRSLAADGSVLAHDPALLTQVANRLLSDGIVATPDSILDGLALFERPVALPVNGVFQTPPPAGTGVGCILCHKGAETTSASIRNLTQGGLEAGDAAFKNSGFDLRMERMFMDAPPVPTGTTLITYDPATYTVIPNGQAARVAVYDAGWYNIGVRPTTEDLGLGATDPFGNALSWTRLFQALPAPGIVGVPGGGLGCSTSPPAAPATSPFAGEVLSASGWPLLTGPLLKSESSDVEGSFKTSTLRNVEFSGPYLHNGGRSTLMQVMDFYDDGGAFKNATLSPLMRPLGLTAPQQQDLVAFLVALTDERVRWQRAPFDHPQLFVPNGDSPVGTDVLVVIPAVGAGGAQTPLERFLGLNPFIR